LRTGALATAGLQLVMLLTAASVAEEIALPQRRIQTLASAMRNCDCVLFMRDAWPSTFAHDLNWNTPDWPRRRIFGAVDPGRGMRARWAQVLGKSKWYVVTYWPARRSAELSTPDPL
jgi:hypothetical protein